MGVVKLFFPLFLFLTLLTFVLQHKDSASGRSTSSFPSPLLPLYMSATRRRRFSSPSPVEFGVAVSDCDVGELRRETTNAAPLPLLPSERGTLAAAPSVHSTPRVLFQTSSSPSQSGQVAFPPEMCCPVCLDPFREPISLVCHHNVCRGHLLDLAAASASGGVLVDAGRSGFDVPCPKCRRVTSFSSEDDAEVNHELMALVNVVTSLLLASQQSPRDAPSADVRHQEASSSAPRRPPLPPLVTKRDATQNSSSGDAAADEASAPPRRVVSFHGIPVDDGPLPVASATSEPHQPVRSSSNSNNSTSRRTAILSGKSPSTGAPATMQALEQHLRQQRALAAELREKEAQAKLELFKRQRREEIQRRQLEPHAEGLGDGRLSRQTPPPRDPMHARSPVSPATGSAEGDYRDETETEINLCAWLSEDVSPHLFSDGRPRSTADVLAHVQRLVQFERSASNPQLTEGGTEQTASTVAPVTDALTSSAKSRVAEGRIAHLFVPRRPRVSRDDDHAALEADVHQTNDQPRAERLLLNESDDEVERRLWEVERRVLRETDEQLTRAEMAEIAERRARAMLSKFRRPTTKPIPKPTYTTKLSRMQSF